jgi:hypothetical protein
LGRDQGSNYFLEGLISKKYLKIFFLPLFFVVIWGAGPADPPLTLSVVEMPIIVKKKKKKKGLLGIFFLIRLIGISWVN